MITEEKISEWENELKKYEEYAISFDNPLLVENYLYRLQEMKELHLLARLGLQFEKAQAEIAELKAKLKIALDALDEILDKDCPYGEGGCFSFEINRIASKAKLKIDGIPEE